MSILRLGLAALLVCNSSCGSPLTPSAMIGDWHGRHPPGQLRVAEIRIEQRGSELTGTACESDRGVLIWSGVPVTVKSGNVTFDVQAQYLKYAGRVPGVFVGRLDSDTHNIIGHWQGESVDVSLGRGGSLCAGAQ